VVGQDCLDLIALVEPGRRVVVFKQSRTVEQFAEAWDRSHRQRQETVGGGIDAVRRGKVGVGVVERAPSWQFAAVVEVSGQHLELEVEHRLQQANLDQPSLAGDPTSNQTGEDALR
jgi:hypothetical protein